MQIIDEGQENLLISLVWFHCGNIIHGFSKNAKYSFNTFPLASGCWFINNHYGYLPAGIQMLKNWNILRWYQLYKTDWQKHIELGVEQSVIFHHVKIHVPFPGLFPPRCTLVSNVSEYSRCSIFFPSYTFVVHFPLILTFFFNGRIASWHLREVRAAKDNYILVCVLLEKQQ